MSELIKNEEDFKLLKDNVLIGEPPALKGGSVEFHGKDNILWCEEGVTLSGKVVFPGDNALVMLCSSRHPYRVDVSANTGSFFYSGHGSYFNGILHAICSEGRSIILGDDCLFSFGIWIRTADPHLVYDGGTHRRINPSKDVLVGDHVWIGQDALLLKGTRIGSGSIIGAKSLVSGIVPSNSSWGGVPVREIRSNIFWDDPCVHAWTKDKTRESQTFRKEPYLFSHHDETKDLDALLSQLYDADSAQETLSVANREFAQLSGNRFYIAQDPSENKKRTLGQRLHFGHRG